MPKCDVCGVSFGEGFPACPICGVNVSAGTSMGAVDLEMVEEVAAEQETESRAATDVSFEPDPAVFQIDGHLGKGLVKPQQVELEPDGYHFKYDQPKTSFARKEPVQKVVEFRVTQEDMERQARQEAEQSQPPIEAETLAEAVEVAAGAPVAADERAQVAPAKMVAELHEIEVETETEPTAELTEPVIETESESNEAPVEAEPPEEAAQPEEPVAELSPEPLAEEPLPEPELELPSPPEVIWTGKQTGILTKNRYEITNQSVYSLGIYGQKVVEVELEAITAVKRSQSLLGQLLGSGDVAIYGPNSQNPLLVLSGVKHPAKITRLLEDLIKARK